MSCHALLPTHQLQFRRTGHPTALESYTVHDIGALVTAEGTTPPFELGKHGFAFGHSPTLVLDAMAMESAEWRHEELFRRLERKGKAIAEQHAGCACASAGRPRPFRGLYTNAHTAHGPVAGSKGTGRLHPLPEAGRHAIRTVYTDHDDTAGLSSHMHTDGAADSRSLHLWVPVVHAPVEQWPLVVVNATQSQVRATDTDWHALRFVFHHRMRLGDYVLLDSSEALHSGAYIEGVPAELPRAAVVFDYDCISKSGVSLFSRGVSYCGAHPPTVVHPTRRSSSPPAAPLAPTRRARTRAGRSRAPPAPPTRSPRRESTPPPPSSESTRSPGWPPPPRRPRPARRRAQEQKSVKIHQPQIFSPAACSNIPCMRRAARSRTLQVGSSAGRSS